MKVYEEPGENAAARGPRRDLLRAMRAVPAAERWLALAALVVVAAYPIRGWSARTWEPGWFEACALLGAGGALVLVGLPILGARLLPARLRTYAFAVAGILPAAGFVIEQLTEDAWGALMLAGGVAMGLLAWQIADREPPPG